MRAPRAAGQGITRGATVTDKVGPPGLRVGPAAILQVSYSNQDLMILVR